MTEQPNLQAFRIPHSSARAVLHWAQGRLSPTGNAQRPIRAWRKPLLLFLSVQIAFWLALFVIETKTQPQSLEIAPSLELFLSESDGTFAESGEPIIVPYAPEPHYYYRDRSGAPRGKYRIYFEKPASDPPYAFFIGLDRHIDSFVLNGEPVPRGEVASNETVMSGFSPDLYPLPTELIVDGENTLDVILDWPRTKVLGHHAVGPTDEMRVAVLWGRAVAEFLPLASMGAFIFAAVLCLAIPWPRKDRLRITLFLVTLAAAAMRNLQFFGIDIFDQYPWLHVTHFLAVYLYLCGLLALGPVWSGSGVTTMKLSIVTYLTAVGLMLIGLPLFPQQGAFWVFPHFFFWGYLIESILTMLCVLVVFTVLLRRSMHAGSAQLIEYGIILFCVMVVGIEHLDHRAQMTFPFLTDLPIKNYFSPLASVVLPLGLCAAVARETARANRVMADINTTLETRLAEKEEQIRLQARDHAIVEERKRLMQDMHDGFGANLYGLISQARTGIIGTDRLADSLQACLDELRLMVDSLDSAGDDLGMALGAFRSRIDGKLAIAGITLQWDIDQVAAQHRLSATEILQVYRILQEACINAIRHAMCTSIKIALIPSRDPDVACVLTVEDNGRGFDQSKQQYGHGLNNMASRAKRVGGVFHIKSTADGTSVQVALQSNDGSIAR
ncbi:MAG: ATP-binding protein [Pseudomonadota bacterium]